MGGDGALAYLIAAAKKGYGPSGGIFRVGPKVCDAFGQHALRGRQFMRRSGRRLDEAA
jgi:hypothetical protein